MINTYTPKFVRNIAIDYYNLSVERCKSIFSGDYFRDETLYLKINAPATILSLSVELSMKAILLAGNSKIPQTHKLTSLYTTIPVSGREQVEDIFAKTKVDERIFPSFRYIKADVDKNYSKVVDASLANDIHHNLEIHDRSFVDWRYIFEVSIREDEVLNFDFSFMIRLSKALFEYSAELIV